MIEFWLMSFWSNREESSGQIELSKGQKAKEGAKTATYSLVIIAGLGAIGTVFYTLFRLAFAQSLCVVSSLIFRELFSSNSPNSLFDKAVADCLAHDKLLDMLGEPVKAFGKFIGVDIRRFQSTLCSGEENRRHRRTHRKEQHYIDPQGRKGVRMQFYLQGVRRTWSMEVRHHFYPR